MSDTTYNTSVNAGRDTVHLIVALILAALLFLLPFLFKIGPNSWKTCAAGATASAAAPTPAGAASVAPSAIKPAPAAAGPVAEAPAVVAPEPAAETPAPAEPATAAVVDEPPPAARVYFALDRYALPGSVEATLADVVGYLKRHPEAKAEIKGFHDRRGKADHNRMLASNRATSVSDYMIAAGIAADRVVISEPAETIGSGPHREARRVEVSVIR